MGQGGGVCQYAQASIVLMNHYGNVWLVPNPGGPAQLAFSYPPLISDNSS